jgi:hypothetical protein
MNAFLQCPVKVLMVGALGVAPYLAPVETRAATAAVSSGDAPLPVLRRSDVVFMYQAPASVYRTYGATVMAWGGRPTPQVLQEAQGLTYFGSVGMVTEFARYHERFPQTYEQGLCRDLNGQPYKVPWLTDHQHKGVPFWWCCTRQPIFQQYISERVADTVKAGAQGVHIDDHLGTAGSLWLGGCFCDRCVAAFRDEIGAWPAQELAKAGITNASAFDVAVVLRQWRDEKAGRRIQSHPLWPAFEAFQLRGAAAFMGELRRLAARIAGKPVPISANAGLLWGAHLADCATLDFFSAEIDHHAPNRRFDESPLVAYRLADAVNRPMASTASGQDWAFVKEQNLPGLVRGWIALGYASGHSLMAPNRQWCYTPEKGTHWYEGPVARFAPLYQFARSHAALLDGFENQPDVVVAIPYKSYRQDTSSIVRQLNRLAAANVSYTIALGGDEVINHPLTSSALRQAPRLLVLQPLEFKPEDRLSFAAPDLQDRRCANVDQVLTNVVPAVRVDPAAGVKALPRVKPSKAAIHLVNWNYDPAHDDIKPCSSLRVRLDLALLGVADARTARWHQPGAGPVEIPILDSGVEIPILDLWGILEVARP